MRFFCFFMAIAAAYLLGILTMGYVAQNGNTKVSVWDLVACGLSLAVFCMQLRALRVNR